MGKEILIVRTQSDNNMSRVRNENPNLAGPFLISRYVSESIRATESFLDNANLPRPPALYHITAQLLMRRRDSSHIIPADPLLLDIDEQRLLIELGIPRIEESDEIELGIPSIEESDEVDTTSEDTVKKSSSERSFDA